MTDEPDPPLDFALQVRNNRWRLMVGLPSMDAAAAVVARIASGPDKLKVAVEVYDPIKDAYERKDYLTFAGQSRASGGGVFKPVGRELRRLPLAAKLAVAAVAIPLLGLAVLGARGLLSDGPAPVTVGAPQEVVVPPPPAPCRANGRRRGSRRSFPGCSRATGRRIAAPRGWMAGG